MADAAARSKPFYERYWWGAPVAILGVWASLGLPAPWTLVNEFVSTDLPASNTEIVLDASARMADPFGTGTKLEAAADAVGDFGVPLTHEGLALRRFGGGCHEKGELVVDFGADHGDEVRDVAAQQRPGGDSNLANAMIAAIDDFADAERFPDPRSPKRVVVFTGTVDDCYGEVAADEIRRAIERTEIDAVFKLVGVKVSKEDREQLRNLKRGLGASAEVAFADTRGELAAALRGLRESLIAPTAAGGDQSEPPRPEPANDPTTALDEPPVDEPAGDEGPRDGFALNRRGFGLLQMDRYTEAIAVLDPAVERLSNGHGKSRGACDEDAAPDTREDCYAYALFNLGHALRLAGRPREAIPILERRLKIPDQTGVVREELAAARAAAGAGP